MEVPNRFRFYKVENETLREGFLEAHEKHVRAAQIRHALVRFHGLRDFGYSPDSATQEVEFGVVDDGQDIPAGWKLTKKARIATGEIVQVVVPDPDTDKGRRAQRDIREANIQYKNLIEQSRNDILGLIGWPKNEKGFVTTVSVPLSDGKKHEFFVADFAMRLLDEEIYLELPNPEAYGVALTRFDQVIPWQEGREKIMPFIKSIKVADGIREISVEEFQAAARADAERRRNKIKPSSKKPGGDKGPIFN